MGVGHVCCNQPVEMAFVQRDDVVEQLAPAAAHPALRDAVLPGGLDTGARRVQTGGLQERDHIAVKCRVVVERDKAMRTISRKHAAVGSRGPLRCRILRRRCSMTKKHESSWKVNVGTAKKSQATMASR